MELCRICLDNDDVVNLISPCLCIGSQKFVHKQCLKKWQDTMLSNILSYPEIYSMNQLNKCNVCSSEYRQTHHSSSLGLLYYIVPVLCFIQKNWFTIVLFLFSLLLVSGLLLVSLIVNFFLVLAIIILYFYWKGIRPRTFATADGFRIGFIRVGQAVQGLRPGILISATDTISEGIFSGSKILITAYDANLGAVGFILNQRLEFENNTSINIGGPVSPSSRHSIHTCAEVPSAEKIIDGLYIGGRVNEISSEAFKSTFMGYSGWGALQLDGEIRAGVWNVLGQATIQDVFPNFS